MAEYSDIVDGVLRLADQASPVDPPETPLKMNHSPSVTAPPMKCFATEAPSSPRVVTRVLSEAVSPAKRLPNVAASPFKVRSRFAPPKVRQLRKHRTEEDPDFQELYSMNMNFNEECPHGGNSIVGAATYGEKALTFFKDGAGRRIAYTCCMDPSFSPEVLERFSDFDLEGIPLIQQIFVKQKFRHCAIATSILAKITSGLPHVLVEAPVPATIKAMSRLGFTGGVVSSGCQSFWTCFLRPPFPNFLCDRFKVAATCEDLNFTAYVRLSLKERPITKSNKRQKVENHRVVRDAVSNIDEMSETSHEVAKEEVQPMWEVEVKEHGMETTNTAIMETSTGHTAKKSKVVCDAAENQQLETLPLVSDPSMIAQDMVKEETQATLEAQETEQHVEKAQPKKGRCTERRRGSKTNATLRREKEQENEKAKKWWHEWLARSSRRGH